MKPLKTLVLATCLVGAVTSFASAKDVNTLAGTMSIPNNVTLAMASNTNTLGIVKDIIAKENAKPNTHQMTRQSNQQALAVLDQMGISYDIYQLQGEDKSGQKDALLVAVDVKEAAQHLGKKEANDPMFIAAMAALDKGQIDPVTEQLLLGTINKQIPTSTTVVPLNGPINVSSRDPQKATIMPKTLKNSNRRKCRTSTSGGWHKISNICSKLSLVICRWKCTNSTLCKCCICVEARKASVVCRYNN